MQRSGDLLLSSADQSAVWLRLRLCCFLLLFSVARSLVAAVDGRHTLSSSASRHRDLIHADRDFSLALAVLHAFEMPSLALQHQKARGALGLSSADRLLAACTGFWVVFLSLWFPRGHLRHLECWCLLPSSQRLTGCNYGHAFSRLLSCTCCSAHIRHGVARAATCKGQGVFHSAALKDCLVVGLASSLFLCCFLGGFL